MAPFQSKNTITSTTTTTPLTKEDLSFEIREYTPEDDEEVVKLIGNGLQQYAVVGDPLYEFWLGYIKKTLTTDVADIPSHYMTKGSTFFVVTATAIDASTGEKGKPIIVGTIAVQRVSDSVAEVKRVSVRADFRRFGLGRMLLSHVQEWAKREQHYQKIVLTTVSTFYHLIKFYDSLGFTSVKTSVFVKEPRLLELTHYEKCL